MDYFYNYLETQQPAWMMGVVSGPSSPPIAETRFRLPASYRHRQYPDITHTVRCEFPTPNWDQAFALTLGREPINPQPYYYAQIHQTYAPFTDGFSRERLSTQLFQKAPKIHYENLDPGARYKIRVFGSGDALLRVDGKRLSPITYSKELNSFKEWIVPLELSRKGHLEVSFDQPEESHLNWRQHSKISDIWLIKQ